MESTDTAGMVLKEGIRDHLWVGTEHWWEGSLRHTFRDTVRSEQVHIWRQQVGAGWETSH